jgi:hypothetical protein
VDGAWYAYAREFDIPSVGWTRWRTLTLDAAGRPVLESWSAASATWMLPRAAVEEMHREVTAHAEGFIREVASRYGDAMPVSTPRRTEEQRPDADHTRPGRRRWRLIPGGTRTSWDGGGR